MTLAMKRLGPCEAMAPCPTRSGRRRRSAAEIVGTEAGPAVAHQPTDKDVASADRLRDLGDSRADHRPPGIAEEDILVAEELRHVSALRLPSDAHAAHLPRGRDQAIQRRAP